jgi:hypothetical protein
MLRAMQWIYSDCELSPRFRAPTVDTISLHRGTGDINELGNIQSKHSQAHNHANQLHTAIAMISGRDTIRGVNLNMLRMAIQGLEMQKASQTAIQQTMAVGVPKKDS